MAQKSSRNPDSFADLTEKTSDVAQFIIFCLAIPTILGIIFAGVVGILVEEPLFAGEWNLGTFLAVVLFSVPFCFYLFLKTRKKKTHQKISDSAFPRQFRFVSLLIFFPQMLGYTLYIILDLVLSYDAFTTIFPLIIGFVYPFITLVFLKLFQSTKVFILLAKAGRIPKNQVKWLERVKILKKHWPTRSYDKYTPLPSRKCFLSR